MLTLHSLPGAMFKGNHQQQKGRLKPEQAMAVGSILLTVPIAFLGSLWVMTLHGLNALQTLGVYSGLGAATLFVLFIGTVIALRNPV